MVSAMAGPQIILLNSGGLRSLVAAALVRHNQPSARLTLLFIDDGRDNAARRLEHAQKQADWLPDTKLEQAALPDLFGHTGGTDADGVPIARLTTPRLLLTALSHAARRRADAVVWPGAFDADFDAVARATEHIELVRHLTSLEADPEPGLDAPLLEWSDRQVVEIGAELETPFDLVWSCLGRGARPCGRCVACQRRSRAFDQAQQDDAQLREAFTAAAR